jgi:mono/diheme cytochrome c family protein
VSKKSKSLSGNSSVIIAGAVLGGLLIALGVAGYWLLSYAGSGAEAIALPADISPEQLAEQRAEAEARLNSYGWVDQEAEVVRLPIAPAMAVVAETGLPVGEPPTPTPTSTPEPTATPAPAPTDETSAPAATVPPIPEATPTPTPTVDLANVSFQNNVEPIFQQHCIQCHGGEQPEGGQRKEEGLSLLSVEEVLAGSWNGSVVEPGDVAGSYLIDQVVSGRMPKEGERLNEAEIEVISAWIEAGAPDN